MKTTGRHADVYQVEDGEKWYTASFRHSVRFGGKPLGEPSWFVTNHRGTPIKRGSRLHRRVVAAIEAGKEESVSGCVTVTNGKVCGHSARAHWLTEPEQRGHCGVSFCRCPAYAAASEAASADDSGADFGAGSNLSPSPKSTQRRPHISDKGEA